MKVKNFPCEVGGTYTRAEVVECKKYLVANTKITNFPKKQKFVYFCYLLDKNVLLLITFLQVFQVSFGVGHSTFSYVYQIGKSAKFLHYPLFIPLLIRERSFSEGRS